MANHKRKKSKRAVRCTLCTKYSWFGNQKGRFSAKETGLRKATKKEKET